MPEVLTDPSSAWAPPQTGRQNPVVAWLPAVVVGLVWLGMFASDLWLIHAYGRNVPYLDDWELVPQLTGQNPVDLTWLFAQHNEHRIPLPRLLLLGLYRATGLDFRAGMFFNAIALAALALGMILAARAVRGRASLFDAVFPLLLLNWGHWQNLLWSWQVQYICSTGLAGALLVLIVHRGNRFTPLAGFVAGWCVVLLPLCGANGVALAPLLALWLGWRGGTLWRSGTAGGRAVGGWMILAAATALLGVILYWVGYHTVEQPTRQELDVRLTSSLKFVGLAFGSASPPWWLETLLKEAVLPVALLGILLLCVRRPLGGTDLVVWLLGAAILRGLVYECEAIGLRPSLPSAQFLWGMVGVAATIAGCVAAAITLFRRPAERPRAAGLLLFVAALGGFALAFGSARAGVVGIPHYVDRYLTLAILFPCWVALVVLLYGGAARRFVEAILLGLGLALAAGSIPEAVAEGRAQAAAIDSFLQEVRKGLAPSVIAQRQAQVPNGVFSRWRQAYLAGCMLLLRDAGHPEFRNLPDDPR